MGFIENEKRRRENLPKENFVDEVAKRSREKWAAGLKRKELHAKSVAYFRESFTPKLVDELSKVVNGNVLLKGYEEHANWENGGIPDNGEISLRLNWDPKGILANEGDSLFWLDLANRFPIIKREDGNLYHLYKSIEIVFSPTGAIRFNGGQGGSSEITYQQWKGKKDVEEASLEKAFKIPGEDFWLQEWHRPRRPVVVESLGSWSESAGPGL